MADNQWTKRQILREVRQQCEAIKARGYTQADRLRWADELEAIIMRVFKTASCKGAREATQQDATLVMQECRARDNFFYIMCPRLFHAMLRGELDALDVRNIAQGPRNGREGEA